MNARASASPALDSKVDALRSILRAHAPLLVAYSGGVDSAYLLAEARHTLGDQVTALIADSPSLPRRALADALALARRIGARLEVIQTGELDNPDYSTNPPNRCYFCKAELFSQMERIAGDRGFAAIAYGENADDAGQVRPGSRAAAEFQVIAPLRDAGLTKAEIRVLSRQLDLPTAEAPAQPCLSSRIPHGTPVTIDALAMVEQAEALLRSLGFRVLRVRHIVNGNGAIGAGTAAAAVAAKIQVAPAEIPSLETRLPEILPALRRIGYQAVEIDPAGYAGG